MGCSCFGLAHTGSCCLGRREQDAWQLRAGAGRMHAGVRRCCVSLQRCFHPPSLFQVTRRSPTPLSTWGSSCLAWRLPCCTGASTGWQQAGVLPSSLLPRGLPTFPGTWGFSWESQADLRKLGVSPGLGGEREQEAACQALP